MSQPHACSWLFDLDGTLIDSISGEIARPYLHELLGGLRARGTRVLVWSAGGAGYIRRRAANAGFDHLLDATFTKSRRDEEGLWRLPSQLVANPPCVLVDDQPVEIPPVGEILGVRPFIGHNPRDRELDALTRVPPHLSTRQEIR